MSWIKVKVILPREPRVLKLAGLLGVTRHEALGLLVDWFCWLDGVTEDGATGLQAEQINSLFECNAKSVTGCNADDVTREDKRRIYKNSKDAYRTNTTVSVENEATERRAGKPLPETAEEVEQFMKAQAICGLKGEELSACTSSFFADMEACGWTARNGAPLFDWHAAARKYLNTWQRKTASSHSNKITYRSEQPINYDL